RPHTRQLQRVQRGTAERKGQLMGPQPSSGSVASRTRLPTRMVLLLVAVLFVSACGGADQSPESTPAPGSASPSVASSGTDDANAEELAPIKWALATVILQPAQSTYSSLPQALGYWEDENLDVEILTFEGASAAAQALDAGQADVAMFGTPALVNLALAS